ncbi:hypothetical protein [Vibrio nomapromontoriensis]|uniref:hypothetical protein n=1 Tax=Vibrio nomapromontoriensis TaxID=2910246 RepID=UPI003D0CDA6F
MSVGVEVYPTDSGVFRLDELSPIALIDFIPNLSHSPHTLTRSYPALAGHVSEFYAVCSSGSVMSTRNVFSFSYDLSTMSITLTVSGTVYSNTIHGWEIYARF